MVSRPTFGTSLRFTASSATSRTVQRTRPSGGLLPTMTMIRCPLALFQHWSRAGPVLLVQGSFQAALPMAMSDSSNRFRRHVDNAGNPQRTHAFGQLQQRQGAQDDAHLLHATAQNCFRWSQTNYRGSGGKRQDLQ